MTTPNLFSVSTLQVPNRDKMDLNTPHAQQWIALIRCLTTLVILGTYTKASWSLSLVLVVSGIALYSLFTGLASYHQGFTLPKDHLLVIADSALAALLVYVTGGIKSPYLSVMYLPVFEAAVGLTLKSAVMTALWTICWLIYFGVVQGFNQQINVFVYQRLVNFSISAVFLATAFHILARIGMRYELRIRNLEAEKAMLMDLADRDPLTGAWNRRAFNRRFEMELNRSRRSGDGLSLIMIDLDDMKEINDRKGHNAGDAALISLTGHLCRYSRSEDMVCRYGGDEFAVLLPGTDAEGAAIWMNRIWPQPESQIPRFSLGVAAYPDHGLDMQSLIDGADASLYQAKNSKRTDRRGGSHGREGVSDPALKVAH